MIPGSANPLLLASAAEAAAGYEIERSLRFNSSDSAYLNADLGTATDQDVFTLSMWVKRSALGSTQQLFGVSTNHSFGFTSGDALNLTFGGSSALTTTALFRDPSAWYHIMWVQNGTSHTLYVNGTSVGTATATSNTFNTAVAHQIGAGNTTNFFNGYLAYIHFIDGQAKTPSAFGANDANGIWQPLVYEGGYGANGFELKMDDNSTAAALGTDTSPNGNDWTVNNITAVSSPGYTGSKNILLSSASLNAGSVDNVVDGDLNSSAEIRGAGSFVQLVFPQQQNGTLQVHCENGNDINDDNIRVFIDGTEGTAFDVSSKSWHTIHTGNFTTVKLEHQGGTTGTIYGFRIGTGGTTIVNNSGSTIDSLVDVPTNGTETDTGIGGEVRGNYCTWNPVASTPNILSNGNLETTFTNASSAPFTRDTAVGSIAVSSGKYYWEVDFLGTNVDKISVGIFVNSIDYSGAPVGFRKDSGNLNNTSAKLGLALDVGAGTLKLYENNTLTYTETFTANSLCIPVIAFRVVGGGSAASICNFGQRPFVYTAPSGHKALCTTNLASTTITTSGSYTGKGIADGPFVYLNGVPTAMTVGGNSVTFGTDADKLSNGFKIRITSTTYNQNNSTYNYTITSTGDPFKTARAQIN